MPFKQKITDEQFAEAFIKCDGHFSQTARYILTNLFCITMLKCRITKKMPDGVFDLNGYILRFPGKGFNPPGDKQSILEAINKKH